MNGGEFQSGHSVTNLKDSSPDVILTVVEVAEKFERAKVGLGLFGPFAPVRRAHVKPPLCASVYPAARNPAARKDERVRLVFVHDGELKFPVEGRGSYRLPH